MLVVDWSNVFGLEGFLTVTPSQTVFGKKMSRITEEPFFTVRSGIFPGTTHTKARRLMSVFAQLTTQVRDTLLSFFSSPQTMKHVYISVDGRCATAVAAAKALSGRLAIHDIKGVFSEKGLDIEQLQKSILFIDIIMSEQHHDDAGRPEVQEAQRRGIPCRSIIAQAAASSERGTWGSIDDPFLQVGDVARFVEEVIDEVQRPPPRLTRSTSGSSSKKSASKSGAPAARSSPPQPFSSSSRRDGKSSGRTGGTPSKKAKKSVTSSDVTRAINRALAAKPEKAVATFATALRECKCADSKTLSDVKQGDMADFLKGLLALLKSGNNVDAFVREDKSLSSLFHVLDSMAEDEMRQLALEPLLHIQRSTPTNSAFSKKYVAQSLNKLLGQSSAPVVIGKASELLLACLSQIEVRREASAFFFRQEGCNVLQGKLTTMARETSINFHALGSFLEVCTHLVDLLMRIASPEQKKKLQFKTGDLKDKLHKAIRAARTDSDVNNMFKALAWLSRLEERVTRRAYTV